MAISYQNALATFDTSGSYSFDVGSGNNRYLVVYARDSGGALTDISYAGVSMTLLQSNFTGEGGGNKHYFYGLANPAAGSNTLVVTGGQASMAVVYNGVGATGQPDATASYNPIGISSPASATITTVADNCWAVWGARFDAGNAVSASTNSTFRSSPGGSDGGTGFRVYDSNAAFTPAGSQSMNATWSSGTHSANTILVSLSPYIAPASTGFFAMTK